MIITFIRHGQKEIGKRNPYLTKIGVEQAKCLARRLKKEKFDLFYCSGMNRAKQTAGIVSKSIKMKPKVLGFLNEFETETLLSHRNKWISKEKKKYNKLIAFLEKLDETYHNKSILIVSHGNTNRVILSYSLNLNLKKLIFFRQEETAINRIQKPKKAKRWRLVFWDDFNHLPNNLKSSTH